MISLRLYDRNGTTLLGLLPEPISYQVGFEFSEVGALSFEYPISGVNASQIAEYREIAIIGEDGVNEVTNGRFVITNINRNRASSAGTISVTARSIAWRLDTALAYPDGGLVSGELSRFYDTKTVGFILKQLIDDAKTRGALTGLTYSFTATNDSNGAAWSDTLTQEYPARNSILSVIRSLQEFGIVEFETDQRQIKATRGDGIGTDKTTGASPVVLRYGQSLTEAPEQTNADRIAGAALIEGDAGLLVERTNATSISTYGRIESSLTASGIDDTAVVNALGDAYLSDRGTVDRQLTVGLALIDGAAKPLTDFKVGDYVFTATTGGLEKVRVRQITISMSGGVVSASATLGDRIYESDIRSAKRLSAITSGSVTLGNGNLITPQTTAVLVNDGIAPSPVTSLTGTSSGYAEGIEPKAVVSLSWTNPTTNSDSTPLTDLDLIEVQMRLLATDEWQFAAVSYTAGARISQLAPNTSYRFRVFAIDTLGNRSAASNEFVITTANLVATETTPSTPVLISRLGTISITWDGLGAGGGAMSSTFSYLAVHVSTSSGFTPGAGTYKGRMNGADTIVLSDLTYGTTYYVKFVAYNKAGTPSTPSTQASAIVQRLVDTDLIANTLTTWPFNGAVVSATALQDGSVSAAKLVDGAVNANKILDGAVSSLKIADAAVSSAKIATAAVGSNQIAAGSIVAGKIAANAVTATEIAAGSITSAKITAGAIGATEIAAGAITAAKISAGAIGATEIAANAVVAGKLAAGAVTAGTIAALAIQAGDIAANAITADKINAGAITAVKIDATAIDGKTITGSTVRTSAGAARVEMNTSGLFAYNASGVATVSLNSSGAANFTGTITAAAGSTVGGFYIGSTYIGASDGVSFYINSSSGNARFTTIYCNEAAGTTGISMLNGANLGMSGGNINMGVGNVNNAGTVTAGTLTSTGNANAVGFVASGSSFLTTTSAAANANIASNGTYVLINSGFSPNVDNTYSTGNLGTSTRRWTRVCAVDTAINSSDLRLKKDVKTSPLGLDFINALRPVSFRWKVGENKLIADEDGVAILDADGNKQYEEVPGVRQHYGFIAQEVKEVLDNTDVEDFAGWVLNDKNDPDSYQSLSYEQFIAPLVKAVQELTARVNTLEASA